jgi:hypothetical protein
MSGIKIKRPGWLKKRGYDPDYSEQYRRQILRKLVKKYGYRNIK